MEKIEAIIFDFGGVLIDLDYNKTIQSFMDLGIENFEEMYSQADQSGLFNDIETGKISPQFFINELLKLLPNGVTPNQVVHAWNAMLMGVPQQSIDILTQLKGKYRLFMLSNTNAIHIEKAWRLWKETSSIPPENHFEKIILSHEIGRRKPHVATFQWVIDKFNLNPKKTLFIDDSIQHIEGAKKAKIQTFHLQSIQKLPSVFS